jgi:integrase
MRSLGYRCSEEPYLRFDRFVERRSVGDEPLDVVISAYVKDASSPALQMERLKVCRVFTRELQRFDPNVPDPPEYDPLVKRAMVRSRCRPHIYSAVEIATLLRTARTWPSPHSPLRPMTLHTMLVLAYCAGLRMGELARLQLGDVHLAQGTLEIRQTKFFKSRRLPLRPTVIAVLGTYLEARRRAGGSTDAASSLFGYAFVTAEQLLRRIILAAGLKPERGRGGARVHDLRHTFVVHRMLEWYRHGINPQSRLPYLATYLGHRDIHSTLVYLTITRDLLGLACERFRGLGADLLSRPSGVSHALNNTVAAAPAAGVLPSVVGRPARRFRPHRARLSRQLAAVPTLRRGQTGAGRR